MFFSPKFFYNDNADGAAGGDPIAEPAKKGDEVKENPVDNLLKELGVESLDSLKDVVRKQKEAAIPDAEKEKQIQLEKANLIKYATENDLAKPDDFNKYESLKAKADRDLVFEKFAAEFREDNTDIDEKDIDTEIQRAFEAEYKLNATSDKIKTRGQERLKKEAQELRSPFESKITSAQTRYNEEKQLRSKYPEYEKFYRDIVKESTPDKIVLLTEKEGDEEVVIDVELTAEDRKAIDDKFLKNPKTFFDYSKGKPEEVKAKLVKKITSFIRERKMEEGLRKSITIGKGFGTKQGSTVGAENPFPLANSGTGSKAPVIDIQESNKKIAEARKAFTSNR